MSVYIAYINSILLIYGENTQLLQKQCILGSSKVSEANVDIMAVELVLWQ